MSLKKRFLETNECLECGLKFNSFSDKSNFSMFFSHLKKSHNMTCKQYYLKHFLNNLQPLCACGCGKETRFWKGEFLKYYEDHKNHMKPNKDVLQKMAIGKEKQNKIEILLKKIGLTTEQIKKTYDEFIKLEKPISQISHELFIDWRTLQSYWFKLELIQNKEEFRELTKISKIKWLNKPMRPPDLVVFRLENSIALIRNYLKDKDKVTFDEIISLVNFKINKNYLSWFLKANLNSSEIKKIKFVKISQLEINFLNVLKFYFGDSVKSSYELGGKIFDYKLGKKILIELDGIYWHAKKEIIENDKVKNEIAKNNGFALIRVSDVEVKKIEFINKVKKIYDELK